MMIELTGLVLPSLNVWQRMHWAKRSRFKRDVLMRVLAAVGRDRTVAAGRRARVVVRQFRPRRIADMDNFYASHKPLLDALVKARLIVDDSTDWIVFEPTQHILAGSTVRVEVEISYE